MAKNIQKSVIVCPAKPWLPDGMHLRSSVTMKMEVFSKMQSASDDQTLPNTRDFCARAEKRERWDQTYWTASWDWTTIFYPLVNVYIANWKITIFKNGQSTISMGHGFNSYFDIIRGYHHHYTIIIPSLITINHHYHHYHYTINTLPEGIFSGIHIPNQATTHRRIGLSFLNVAEMMDHVWPITVKLRRSNGARITGWTHGWFIAASGCWGFLSEKFEPRYGRCDPFSIQYVFIIFYITLYLQIYIYI